MLGESSQYEIRPGEPSDAPALSEVFAASWTGAYRGIIPHLHLDRMIRRRSSDWWSATLRSGSDLLVLQVSDAVVGYATLGPARGRSRYEGEIYEIYISPDYQGLGFGECLFEGCRNHLDGRQLNGLLVWALADNTIASDFYWRRGGRPVGATIEAFGAAQLKKVAFAWD